MIKAIGKPVQYFLKQFGYKIIQTAEAEGDMDSDKTFSGILERCERFTMTSKERMYALYKGVEYLVKNNIRGDFVECGVWRGGSSMLVALTLLELKAQDRSILLYDTFEGMPEPTPVDSASGDSGDTRSTWEKNQKQDHNEWCYASLDEVRKNMTTTGYPMEKVQMIKGKVEETIPGVIPENIALLRLDTDWYESTRHELQHLYPLLVKKGVLLIDDYGYWTGAKKAVDEYFTSSPMLLNRIDNTGRIGIKP